MAFSPWTLRSIVWDYVDGFAISYCLAGFCCALTAPISRRVNYILAGLFFALAINANIYSAAVIVFGVLATAVTSAPSACASWTA